MCVGGIIPSYLIGSARTTSSVSGVHTAMNGNKQFGSCWAAGVE